MKNIDSHLHVTGRSVYVDDIPEQSGTLKAWIYYSKKAHALLKSMDLSAARAAEGVVRIFTHEDIPGQNEIGGIIQDEPLLADREIHFLGMPLALVVAETEEQAARAAKLIKVELEELPVVTDPRVAKANGDLIVPSRTFSQGKVDFDNCKYVFEGQAESGGQEHLYIETQGAYAVPDERNTLKIYSSTQGPTAVQRTVARILKLPMHKIEVEVGRLGGGFGGKEDQASAWAALAALAAHLLQKPVKCILHRMEDMQLTGKRHPYSSDYKIGLDADLNIAAYAATFFQNAGASADLSPAVMERTLFHGNNSYHLPNVQLTAHCCKTNLPPNTAFRGFGGPQGMFVIESAIAHAAKELGVQASKIQQQNLLSDGDSFPYGQIAAEAEAKNCWHQLAKTLEAREKEVTGFNAGNKLEKKGLAVMPICFGISFTNTRMNHARALVHVYEDGSVGVSTGGVEMGQGINTKMLQVAAETFGLPADRIKLEKTNTSRVANTSPSAASATADLNGKALINACQQILDRLFVHLQETKKWAAGKIEVKNGKFSSQVQAETQTQAQAQTQVQLQTESISWEELITSALDERVNLSAKGHYATPIIHFDKSTEKGHPFAYHVYGSAVVVAKVDCLRGNYTIETVDCVHDYGASMNKAIDLGQTEGGIVQGLGWMTMEELAYDEKGRLLSNALSTYKIPDIYAVPEEINVHFLKSPGSEWAIKRSKAVGEPPLMYGIGGYFAIANAVLAFNPTSNLYKNASAPITPEKVLLSLYESSKMPQN